MIPRTPEGLPPRTPECLPPRTPEGPPPGSPAIINTNKNITAAAAKKEAKTAAATANKEAKARETAANKEAKARETAANKQRKSAEVARKKVLSELKKNQKILRLAAEKEEKKQARIAAQQARIAARQAQRVAQREALVEQRRALVAQRRDEYQRRLAQAHDERRADEPHNRQIRMISRCLADTTADTRSAPRTQAQLTCAATAFQTDECPICLEDLGETNCMVLRCGHKTCGDCILTHFQRVGGRKCPVCRDQYAVRVKGWIAPTPYGVPTPPYNI